MAEPVEGLQYPYLFIINISPLEHLNIYKKKISGLPESDRYNLTRYKWTELYQELEDSVSTFGFKVVALIVTARYGIHVPTEFKNIIVSYPYITQAMM